MTTKSEFVDWKRHPVTQEVFAMMMYRAREMEEILGSSAGLNSLEDRFKVGYIAACRDLFLADFDDTPEEGA